MRNHASRNYPHPLNESRFEDWKGSSELAYIDKNNGNPQIAYNGKRYDYFKICEEMTVTPSEMKNVSADKIIAHLNNRNRLNEARYDWNHIDPITGMPRERAPREEEKIELMNRLPQKRGYIVLLHNRVNMRSRGNISLKRKVFYDPLTKKVTDEKDGYTSDFRTCTLKNGARPGGWMYAEDCPLR